MKKLKIINIGIIGATKVKIKIKAVQPIMVKIVDKNLIIDLILFTS